MSNWKDIPGFEGLYQINKQGQVKSCDRVVPDKKRGKQERRGNILKQSTQGVVTLSKQNKRYTRSVHQLRIATFAK